MKSKYSGKEAEDMDLSLQIQQKQILSQRIHDRGTDSEEVIQKRLSQITRELALAHQYDYIIVNDVLKQAVRKTSAILEAERCKLSRNEGQIETIFKQYITKEVSSK